MTEDQAAGQEEPFASLLDVFDDPSAGWRRLPWLVGLFDHDEERVRIGAAWAICLVAGARPETTAYLTSRLVDRVTSDSAGPEAELVFGFLTARFPDAVADELDGVETENEGRVRPIRGNLTRANYHLPEIGERNVGRTRLPGEDGSAGPQQVYDDTQSRDDSHDRSSARVDEETNSADENPGKNGDRDGNEDRDEGGDGDSGGGGSDLNGTQWEPADELPTIVYRSRFDQLTVLAKRRRGRYADIYRTLGVLDGEQLPVGMALYHLPDDRGDEFATVLGEQLGRWTSVCDHDNVVTLHDWHVDPQPWAATEYTGERLVDRNDVGLSEALWNVRELADALAYVHENGVVHGGIDPGNVVYYGNVVTETERQPPLLTNVGLLDVVRRHFDPASRLDPRYAAPEYFDRQFGRIDHATDIYQLGAVLYRLVTGRPPFDGEYDRIRKRVLTDPVPRPGDVVDVPPQVDDVVTKAMARQKLRRYETVRHLEQEVRSIENLVSDYGE